MGNVEQALGSVTNVASVKFVKRRAMYYADVTMKKGYGLSMSEFEKVLKVNILEVDGSLSLSVVQVFKTETEPDAAKLKAALDPLPGFQSVWTYKEGFGVVFTGERQPTCKEIGKASGLEVVDLILAPSKEGARYFCRSHPEMASVDPVPCPQCRTEMVKSEASATTDATGSPSKK